MTRLSLIWVGGSKSSCVHVLRSPSGCHTRSTVLLRRSVAVVRPRRRRVVKELRPLEGDVVPRGVDSSGVRKQFSETLSLSLRASAL